MGQPCSINGPFTPTQGSSQRLYPTGDKNSLLRHEVSHLAFNVAREKARLHTEFWEMFFRMFACSGSLVEILRAAARARRAAGKPSTHGDMEWRSIWVSSFLTFFSTSSPAGNDRLTGVLEEGCNLMNLSFAPPLLHRGTWRKGEATWGRTLSLSLVRFMLSPALFSVPCRAELRGDMRKVKTKLLRNSLSSCASILYVRSSKLGSSIVFI
jgi:hypothetical protein